MVRGMEENPYEPPTIPAERVEKPIRPSALRQGFSNNVAYVLLFIAGTMTAIGAYDAVCVWLTWIF
jgi:hypothetical protein